jgi:hypothetical protein
VGVTEGKLLLVWAEHQEEEKWRTEATMMKCFLTAVPLQRASLPRY